MTMVTIATPPEILRLVADALDRAHDETRGAQARALTQAARDAAELERVLGPGWEARPS